MKKLVIAVILTLILAPCLAAAPPSVQDLLRWVPASAQVVMAVNGAALRAHPLVQSWLLEHPAGWSGVDTDLKRFLEDAGLDPVRDVDAMVVATSALGSGHNGGFAVFAGHYDVAALGTAFAKRGGVAEKIAGTTVYSFTSEHGKSGGVALFSNDLVIAGDEATLRTVLGQPAVSSNLASQEIAAGHIDPRAPFWLAAVIPEQARAKATELSQRMHGEGSNAVSGVVAASGAVQRATLQAFLDDNLRLSGLAQANTAENAELLRDLVKGALATMRLNFQEKSPELVEVLRNVEVKVKANEVSVAGSIPIALLQKLAAEHKATATHPAETHI
jgi:hypothetical protein